MKGDSAMYLYNGRLFKKGFLTSFMCKTLLLICIVFNLQILDALAEDSGYKGQVWDKNVEYRISDVQIIFENPNGTIIRKVISNDRGLYRISLPPGKYYVTVEHPNFKKYTSRPGFFGVTENRYQQGNFFLEKK
jgi:hypothetical protein